MWVDCFVTDEDYRVTTYLENLELSGNFKMVRESHGKLLKPGKSKGLE